MGKWVRVTDIRNDWTIYVDLDSYNEITRHKGANCTVLELRHSEGGGAISVHERPEDILRQVGYEDTFFGRRDT